MNVNGEGKELPVIHLGWDEKTKSVELAFDHSQFPSWDFVLGVLEMARLKAERIMRALQAQQMQQAMQMQQQEQAVVNNLKSLRGNSGKGA